MFGFHLFKRITRQFRIKSFKMLKNWCYATVSFFELLQTWGISVIIYKTLKTTDFTKL